MVDLTDNNGDQIRSDQEYWYKIALADGREIGLGEPWKSSANNGRTLLKVVPAGQGIVWRYQRFDGDNRPAQGWPIGDKGYLRGLQVNFDGSETIKHMSVSAGSQHRLCGYDDNNNYGLVAEQLPKHRVALYAYNGSGNVCGLRVTADNIIIAHESGHAMALDCEFVRVSTRKFIGLF
ncbi:hypothetical protein B0I35DRAFT_414546 [Stachybotrys elegans]|uniref:Uncharacterized protein n=1 Tax=Stachybotrys elegans TaxID=80388 RepID=A0A8K0S9U6_9HYPO|nr:hypothetical protein B0I35DRAFT_414546 [Stachybotrys elegans]